MNISYYDSPIGILRIKADEQGICGLSLGRKDAAASETNQGCQSPYLLQAQAELEEYFAGRRKVFSVPLSLQGTAFQLQVWNALRQIPYGETLSYSDIATVIGNPKACRAVGMANNRNPVMIIVPCHRVIGKNGSLVGYGGGLDVKKKLLALEKTYR